MNGLLGVNHLARGLLSQPRRIGARTQSRNTLGINHPLSESSHVARIPISMMPFIGGGASGYTLEDLATLQLPEETTLFSPLGFDITDKNLATLGLTMDAVDWVPGAAVVGGMATSAGLLGRALKGKNYAPTTTEDVMSGLLGQRLQHTGALDDAMVGVDPSPFYSGEKLTKEQRALRTAELRAEANALRFGDDDYRIQHSSPAPEGKNSIDDPSDIYDHNIYGAKGAQYYGTGDPAMDKATIKILNEVKQNPDSLVTIYRAVPSDVDDAINAGDWITINKDYAKSHGESALNGDYKIIEQQARAGDIFTNGDSLHEQGWHPGNRDPAIATTLEPSVDLIKRDDMWELSKIETPLELRGKGLADAELTKILEEADTAGVPIGLTPSTAFGANKNKLTKWYKRHGFVPNKGRNKNFLTRESMIRHPRKIAEPSVDEFIGGLLSDELPLDEASRMQRAQEMRFDTDMYHLTDKDFSEFIPGGPENIDDQGAIFFRPDPSTSASQHNVSFKTEGAREMPVKIRGDSPLYIDEYNQKEMRDRYGLGPEFPWIVTKEEAAKLQKLGFTHVEVEHGGKVEEIAVFDPKNIRSKFAKFDPAKKDSANILAGAAGAGVLSGLYEPKFGESK